MEGKSVKEIMDTLKIAVLLEDFLINRNLVSGEIVGQTFVLHMAVLVSILNTLYGSLSPARVVPKCRWNEET